MCEVHPGGLPSLVEEKAFSFIIIIFIIIIIIIMRVKGSICSWKVLHPGGATLPSGGKGLQFYFIIIIYRKKIPSVGPNRS